jgi:hypothetical protein
LLGGGLKPGLFIYISPHAVNGVVMRIISYKDDDNNVLITPPFRVEAQRKDSKTKMGNEISEESWAKARVVVFCVSSHAVNGVVRGIILYKDDDNNVLITPPFRVEEQRKDKFCL